MLKQFAFCLIAIGICVLMVTAQSSGKVKNKTDEAQIKNILVSFAAWWNAHDMNKFSELFTPDADWVNIRGSRWTGVDEIRENHIAVHKMFFSQSRLEFADTSIRMIAPDAAVIHAREIITNSNMPKEAGITTDSQMSLVVVRRAGKWLIANGQNTNIAAPAAANSGRRSTAENAADESGKTVTCADNDTDCFIRAATTCRKATLTNNAVADFGTDQFTQIVFYEIKGGSISKCEFYLKILDWKVETVELSVEEKAKMEKQLIEDGWTAAKKTEEQQKESAEMRKAMEKRMKDHIGTDGVCSFKAENLAALFERWKSGRFSSNDYKGANCRGTYFSEANGFPKNF